MLIIPDEAFDIIAGGFSDMPSVQGGARMPFGGARYNDINSKGGTG